MHVNALVLCALVIWLFELIEAGIHLEGRVEFPPINSNNNNDFIKPATLSVRLGAQRSLVIMTTGKFKFEDIPLGTHEVSVSDSYVQYSRVFVEITTSGGAKYYEVFPNPQNNAQTLQREIPELVLKPLGYIDYFEKRQQMTLSQMFMNPMVMMMLMTFAMAVVLPKMMENLDPEELKEINNRMQEQQKLTADPSKLLQGILAGGEEVATASGDEEEEEEKPSTAHVKKQVTNKKAAPS